MVEKSKEREIYNTYLVLEINGRQSCFIMSRHSFFEERLKGKGLFNPHTIGNREARTTKGSGIREDDGNELRNEEV